MDLFKLDNVCGVFLGREFITVNKKAEGDWEHMKPLVFGCIMDFWAKDVPVMMGLSSPEHADTKINDDDDEVVAMIKELLETRIRPSVQEDGGDIFYV